MFIYDYSPPPLDGRMTMSHFSRIATPSFSCIHFSSLGRFLIWCGGVALFPFPRAGLSSPGQDLMALSMAVIAISPCFISDSLSIIGQLMPKCRLLSTCPSYYAIFGGVWTTSPSCGVVFGLVMFFVIWSKRSVMTVFPPVLTLVMLSWFNTLGRLEIFSIRPQ